MSVLSVFSVLAVVAVTISGAHAWGNQGHQAVGYIAGQLLNSNAANSLNTILAGSSLYDVATWADQIKSSWTWSKALHYADTQDWACKYNAVTDCKNNICVVGAIFNYTNQLLDSSTSSNEQNIAAKFITHFLGDLTQPLHLGFIGDLGGNKISVTYVDGSSTNLHAVWDSSIIEQRLNDFNNDVTSWASSLVANASSNAAAWSKCSTPGTVICPDEWAQESAQDACTDAYMHADGSTPIQDGDSLDPAYYTKNLPIIEQRIMKGGAYLATVMNYIFSQQQIVAY